jgi:hypothetical protein
MIAVYRLPFPIGLTGQCDGIAVATKLGGITGRVVLPRLEWKDDYVFVEPPRVRGLSSRMVQTAERDELGGWGQIHAYERKTRAVTWSAEMIVLCFSQIPTRKFSYGAYIQGRGAPEGKPVDALFDAINGWSRSLADWVEVFKDQDCGRVGTLTSVTARGQGLSVWTREGSIDSGVPALSHHITFVSRDREMVDPAAWRRILRMVEGGTRIPDEHRLVADARAWLRRNEYRRAVIDAGTVAELALTRLMDNAIEPVPKPIRKRLSAEHRPLGRLIELVGHSTGVPMTDLRALVQVRNQAVHANASAERREAAGVVATAGVLAELVQPLRQLR